LGLQTIFDPFTNSLVFMGPNHSGKTSALQALALLDVGWGALGGKPDESSASEDSLVEERITRALEAQSNTSEPTTNQRGISFSV
jgi:hypothetical protein